MPRPTVPLVLALLAVAAAASGGGREEARPEGALEDLERARLEEALVRSERTALLLGRLLEARAAWHAGGPE